MRLVTLSINDSTDLNSWEIQLQSRFYRSLWNKSTWRTSFLSSSARTHIVRTRTKVVVWDGVQSTGYCTHVILTFPLANPSKPSMTANILWPSVIPTLTAALTAAFIPAAGAPTFKTATLKLVCKIKTILNKDLNFYTIVNLYIICSC